MIAAMRWLSMIACLCLALPAQAQEEERGRDLMAEALRLFMQGFMAEMEPAIEDLELFLRDLNAYHPPEVLPNGDIIIRRKTPLEREAEGEGGEVEL
jgi:hypothetical protein